MRTELQKSNERALGSAGKKKKGFLDGRKLEGGVTGVRMQEPISTSDCQQVLVEQESSNSHSLRQKRSESLSISICRGKHSII